MVDIPQRFRTENLRRIAKNMQAQLAADRDALVYGRGYLSVDSRGYMTHIPAQDVMIRIPPPENTEVTTK